MPLTWDGAAERAPRIRPAGRRAPAGPTPSALTVDSRSVGPGSVYLAVRGSQADGHRFVADAVGRGASAVVVEAASGSGVPEIVVRDGRRAALVLGAAWFGHPARRLTLVGVTGTNGKTTTTGLIRHLLNATGASGSIGTLGAFDGRGEPVSSTAGTLTTPGPIDLQATLAALVERGVDRVTMEASSHSLDQGRLDGLVFAAGVFTNLTRDHLDYHATMESYLAAKLKLGSMLADSGVEVVNLDDAAWEVLPVRSRQGDVRAQPGGGRARRRGRPRRGGQPLPPRRVLRGRRGSLAAPRRLQRGERPRRGGMCPGPRRPAGRSGRHGSPRRPRCRAAWSCSPRRPASSCATTRIRPTPWSGRSRRCGR